MYPLRLVLDDIPLPVLKQESCLCSLVGPSWGGEAGLTLIPLKKPVPCYYCSPWHTHYPRQWENPLSNKTACLEAFPAVGCSGLAGDKVVFVLGKGEVRMALAVGLFHLSVIWLEMARTSQSHGDLANGKWGKQIQCFVLTCCRGSREYAGF